jgi:hypothetical protein
MLSSTIFFFHGLNRDPDNDPKLTNVTKEVAHHVVKNDFFITNEIANADRIREINLNDGSSSSSSSSCHFYIFDTVERLKIAETSSLSSNTNIIKSNSSNLLLTFAKRDLMHLDQYLSSLSSSKKFIFELIEVYRQMLQTIHLLVSGHLIHNNINFNTIAVDLTINKPVLTNFRHSLDYRSLSKSFAKEYWSQYFLLKKIDLFCPIEFYLLNYQLTNKSDNGCLSLYNIETVVKQFIKDHAILNAFSSKTINFLDDGLKFFARYANKSFGANLEEALKYCWTWDNYALSIVYLEILIGLHQTINANTNANNKFIISFMKLLVNNICLDPSKRSKLSLDLFEEMLLTIEIKDFKEVLDHI